jgi:hypothetical protein
MRHIFLQVFIILLCCHREASAQEKKYYGTYGHTPQGSTRAMGMGGAYTGVSDDASGIIYNPAGLAHATWIADFGSTTNLTVNKEADVNGDSEPDGVAYQFQFNSAAVRLGPMAFAIGQSSPFSTEIQQPGSSRNYASMQIRSTDVLFATRLGSTVALGVTYKQTTLSQSYQSFAVPIIENEVHGVSYTAGISIRPRKNLGLGMDYSPRQEFEVDPNTNLKIQNNSFYTSYGWFQGAKIPEKLSFGGFFRASERLMYAADLDFLRPDSDMIYVESPFNNDLVARQDIKSSTVQIPHGGIEYIVLNEKKRSVTWRVGGYREPARIVSAADRLHFTMGVEIRLGPLILSASMDESSGFTNSTQRFGLSLGDL